MAEPQPAELTTTASTPARSKTSIVRRANRGRLGPAAAVQRQRAAAALARRDDHVTPLGGQDVRRRVVDLREEDLLHAPGEHADHGPAGAAGGHPLRQRPLRRGPAPAPRRRLSRLRDARRAAARLRGTGRSAAARSRALASLGGGSGARRSAAASSGAAGPPGRCGPAARPAGSAGPRAAARSPPGACAGRGTARRSRPAAPGPAATGAAAPPPGCPVPPTRAGPGAVGADDAVPGDTRAPARPVPARAGAGRLLGPAAGGLDQPVVADPGGAGGDAGHAAQAAVQVLAAAAAARGAVEDLGDQVDAPAGRVHLLAPQLVGGAGRQAEPAVHAVRGQVPQLARRVERRAPA